MHARLGLFDEAWVYANHAAAGGAEIMPGSKKNGCTKTQWIEYARQEFYLDADSDQQTDEQFIEKCLSHIETTGIIIF